ncbi:MAG: YidC/Oxa1 family membrane protein insertase [Patescibacteria group bacterium]|nr:YidC/Oxa1 family membrane protein insertase [Patescibacteria group bacterium]
MHLLWTLFVQPEINLLVFFYSILPGHDFGVAVILLTVVVRLIVWPLQSKTLRNQKAMNKLQPEINKIKEKYKNDPTKINTMTMELYKEKEINPLSSCLPTLIQLPLLFALFYAIRPFGTAAYIDVTNHAAGLWKDIYPWLRDMPFVKDALSKPISTELFGIINLTKPNWALALIAAALQFVQSKMIMPKKNLDATQKMFNQTLYIFPVMTFIIGLSFPAALPLYWIVQTLMMILQQYLIMHRDVEKLEEEKK